MRACIQDPLEVRLRVVPLLYQAVAQAQGRGLVALKVVKAVAAAGHGVLDVADNVLLDAEHIVFLVCICVHMAQQQCP